MKPVKVPFHIKFESQRFLVFGETKLYYHAFDVLGDKVVISKQHATRVK